jgi:hypothetical protein
MIVSVGVMSSSAGANFEEIAGTRDIVSAQAKLLRVCLDEGVKFLEAQ